MKAAFTNALLVSSFFTSSIALANDRIDDFYRPSHPTVQVNGQWAPALPKRTTGQKQTTTPAAKPTAPVVETVSVDSPEYKAYEVKHNRYEFLRGTINRNGYKMPGEPIKRLGYLRMTRAQFDEYNRRLDADIPKMEEEIEFRNSRNLTAAQRDTRPRAVGTKELSSSKTAKVLKKGASKVGAFAGVAAILGHSAARASVEKSHISNDILLADTIDRTPRPSVESFGAESFSAPTSVGAQK